MDFMPYKDSIPAPKAPLYLDPAKYGATPASKSDNRWLKWAAGGGGLLGVLGGLFDSGTHGVNYKDFTSQYEGEMVQRSRDMADPNSEFNKQAFAQNKKLLADKGGFDTRMQMLSATGVNSSSIAAQQQRAADNRNNNEAYENWLKQWISSQGLSANLLSSASAQNQQARISAGQLNYQNNQEQGDFFSDLTGLLGFLPML